MHKLAEKIADCLKAKVEGKGIDNIEGQDLVEFELWSKVIKNLVCYDKDKKIIEAMDEAEDAQEAIKYIEMYENYPEDDRKGYRGQPRDSRGKYMSRRGYESRMVPEMDYDEMERMRDMDRPIGRMGYSGSGSMGGSQGQSGSGSSSMSGVQSNGGSMSDARGYSESRYDRARRGYEETKSMHKDNSPESKQMKMKSLEDYMKSLAEDVTDMVNDMSQEEKSLMKQKMQVLMQKIQ